MEDNVNPGWAHKIEIEDSVEKLFELNRMSLE